MAAIQALRIAYLIWVTDIYATVQCTIVAQVAVMRATFAIVLVRSKTLLLRLEALRSLALLPVQEGVDCLDSRPLSAHLQYRVQGKKLRQHLLSGTNARLHIARQVYLHRPQLRRQQPLRPQSLSTRQPLRVRWHPYSRALKLAPAP